MELLHAIGRSDTRETFSERPLFSHTPPRATENRKSVFIHPRVIDNRFSVSVAPVLISVTHPKLSVLWYIVHIVAEEPISTC